MVKLVYVKGGGLLRNGVLSYKDITKLIGKEIYIYPYNEKNLKECSYNLTLSKYAYSIYDKKLLINKKNQIVIPSQETVILITEESIYVTGRICGTYHSKVSLVSRGLSHISTTLDPYYIGKSAITVHNNSNKPIILNPGDTFATIIFYRLSTKVPKKNKDLEDNHQSRKEIVDYKLNKFKDSTLEEKFIQNYLKEIKNWSNNKCMVNEQAIINGCKKNLEDIRMKSIQEKEKKYNWGKIGVFATVIGVVVSIIIAIVTNWR